jgi:predicted transposase/invertase (TIGR01784 family)
MSMNELRLMNDLLFKIVFGSEKHEHLLRGLLNGLLSLSGADLIVELTLLNPTLDKANVTERGLVLDVHARDGRGRLYNIEVQIASQPHYVARSLYYLANLFGTQLNKGENFSQIKRTIGISLLDFVLFPEIHDFRTTYRFCDIGSHRQLSDIVEIHYIELPKFTRSQPLETKLERWLTLLKFSDMYQKELEPIPEELKEEEDIVMAMDAMKQACADHEVRNMVRAREMARLEWNTQLENARQEGKREDARRMYELGLDVEMIFQVTGLRTGEY